jgi:predicted nucleic acid binding AN1-type Zn finger protein
MFTCPCCKMQFCVSHRLPECHDCKNYDLVKEKTKIELVKLEETKRALVRF